MRHGRRARRLMLLAAVSLAAPAAAEEQPRAELFGGYSFLHQDEDSFHGWNAAVAFNLTDHIGVVGDASGHYGSAEGADLSRTSFMGGPAFTLGRGSIGPFVHALFGVVREKASIRILDVDISETESDFGMLFGGGLDFRLSPRWAVRAQGDYRLVRHEGESEHAVRLSAGVVLRTGNR